MTHLLHVARIQLVNARAVLGLPLLILAVTMLANLVIFAAAGAPATEDEHSTGAMVSIYFVMLAVHLQTMTQVFPFAVSLGVTRRAFFGATALVVVAQSLAYGVLLYLFRLVEEATGGWGIDMTFFALPFMVQDNPILQIAVYTGPFLLLSFVGVLAGIVFKRWGQLGVYVLCIGSALLAVAFVAVTTWQEWWPAVGRFFTGQPTALLLAGYPLVLAVLIAGAGYLTARRAVP